jgi:chromosome condensin MukBEF ATPase and DNA-binding subunit MukB
VKVLRVELKEQGISLSNALAERDEARASVRVISEERQQMKTEWADMFSAHDGLKARIADLLQQVQEGERSQQVCSQPSLHRAESRFLFFLTAGVRICLDAQIA